MSDGQKIRWTATPSNAMSAEEIEQFLSEPHVACLATNRADGFPHVYRGFVTVKVTLGSKSEDEIVRIMCSRVVRGGLGA